MQANKKNRSAIEKDEHILAADIRAFEQLRSKLEREHLDKFVLFFRGKFVEVFSDFESAASAAIARFGRGPYLIRQVGKNGWGAGTAAHLR